MRRAERNLQTYLSKAKVRRKIQLTKVDMLHPQRFQALLWYMRRVGGLISDESRLDWRCVSCEAPVIFRVSGYLLHSHQMEGHHLKIQS